MWNVVSYLITGPAMFGLIVIAILVISSVYVITAYPYNKLADIWYMKALSGKIYMPRLAAPSWATACG